ncbi:hypothetical protein P154DRAFT_485871 [Amniculicola lignicola CBS 123094]|uniref:Uncharacterized protein n=1 Tax=Amniculicola lignicola CBS 123094 TaxID=1392246 RepID=A0A6A5WRG2_9PLEO|nr:hypothetical protein P154DRAFT_485871 [Amniculicola lignicola CBS 123094]
MSELDSRFVKRGFWNDVEKGPVMGKTITTDIRAGAFVIALLAILSGLGTAHLWNLFAFALHQIRANGQPRDALFRQQQALLRTLPTPGALIADSLKLFWHWRGESGADRPLLRSTLHVLLGLVFVAMTWTASIFSSLVVDTTNIEVLVSSPYCGAINLTSDTAYDISVSYTTKVITVAEPFADNCYLAQNQSLPALCNALIRPKKLFNTAKAACPFNSTMCIGNDTPALQMDSGLIDLNEFGLNLPRQHRVQFRKSTTCAVLPLEGRTTIINATDFAQLDHPALPQEQLLLLHYGEVPYRENWQNATFLWSLSAANTSLSYDTQVSTAAGSEAWQEYSNQVTLPEMQREDADVVLRMIAKNYMVYRETNEDPVFSAHKSYNLTLNFGATVERYYSDYPASVIACAQQYQYCVAQENGKPFCTALSSLPPNPTPENFPAANDIQLAALQLLVTSGAMYDQGTSGTFDALTQNWMGEIASLPNNQWEKEVIRWETIAWAGLQALIADYAIGPKHRDQDADGYVKPVTTKGEKQLCRAQKMRKSGGFVNINVFGLVFITTFSCLIAIIDITLLKVLIWVSEFRRFTGLSVRLSRWTQDGVLQLQRRAYEAQGVGFWINVDTDVPLTREKEELRDLPLETVMSGVVYMDHKRDGKWTESSEREEEEAPPQMVRSAKTWATQDTVVSMTPCSPTTSKDSISKS